MAIETMLQVVEQIPKSPSGKILHRILEEIGRAALPDAYWLLEDGDEHYDERTSCQYDLRPDIKVTGGQR